MVAALSASTAYYPLAECCGTSALSSPLALQPPGPAVTKPKRSPEWRPAQKKLALRSEAETR